jgi:hypothetical protein
MDVMATPLANFPDAMIGLSPTGPDQVRHPDDPALRVAVESV